MQLEHKSIHRWAYDPFCPIDFRLQDAQCLAEGERTKWADEDDPLVLDCAAYLKALNAATTARERVSARARWPLIRATIDFAEENTFRGAEVRARLLAGQSDRQIAARCKVRPKLVGHFERLHFAVRHALKARDYLVKHALGRDIFVDQGFGDKEVAEFWGWCAIHGGVAVVDFMVERLRDVVAPGNEPTMMAYFDRRVPLAVQGFVASHALPYNEPMATVWYTCGLRSSEARAKGDEDEFFERDIQRRVLVRLARHHFAGKPLPIPLAAPEPEKRAAKGGGKQQKPVSKSKVKLLPTVTEVRKLVQEIGDLATAESHAASKSTD